MPDIPLIVADTREQLPHTELDGSRCTYERHGLDICDYALRCDCIEMVGRETYYVASGVERKSITDFINSWFGRHRVGSQWIPNRRREERKIAIANWRNFRMPYFLDGNEVHIARYRYDRFPSGRVTADAVMSVISGLRERGHQVVLCNGKAAAELQMVQFFRRRAERFGRFGVREF